MKGEQFLMHIMVCEEDRKYFRNVFINKDENVIDFFFLPKLSYYCFIKYGPSLNLTSKTENLVLYQLLLANSIPTVLELVVRNYEWLLNRIRKPKKIFQFFTTMIEVELDLIGWKKFSSFCFCIREVSIPDFFRS